MDVHQVAALANLHLNSATEKKLQDQFEDTLTTVARVNDMPTTGVEPTSQVTGLTNVTREDIIDPSRVLTQAEATSQAKNSINGYFVVPSVLHAD